MLVETVHHDAEIVKIKQLHKQTKTKNHIEPDRQKHTIMETKYAIYNSVYLSELTKREKKLIEIHTTSVSI